MGPGWIMQWSRLCGVFWICGRSISNSSNNDNVWGRMGGWLVLTMRRRVLVPLVWRIRIVMCGRNKGLIFMNDMEHRSLVFGCCRVFPVCGSGGTKTELQV